MRAVLFDFSGTLFDDLGALDPRRVSELAQARSIELDAAAAATLIERTMRHLNAPERFAEKLGSDLSIAEHQRIWTGMISDSQPGGDGLAGVLYDSLTDNESWHPYPDARGVLATLRARGVRIGIVSNIGWDIRGAIARAIDPALLDAVILSYEVGYEKPDPRIFALACERMGTAPGETLYVGDDPAKDGPAIDAGLPVYLLPSARERSRPRGLAAVFPLLQPDHDAR